MKHNVFRTLKMTTIMLGIICTLVAVGLLNGKVYASDPSSIINKWRWAHYYDCMNQGGWNHTIDLTKDKDGKIVKRVFKDGNGDFYLPSYQYGHSSSKTSISCFKTIEGTDGWTGSLEGQKNIKANQPGQAETLLKNLGFVPENEDKKQFTIHAMKHTHSRTTTFWTTENDWEGEASSAVVTAAPKGNGVTTYSVGGWDNAFNSFTIDLYDGKFKLSMEPGFWTRALTGCSAVYDDQSIEIVLDANPEVTRQRIEDALRNKTWAISCHMTTGGAGGSGIAIYTTTDTLESYYFDIDHTIVDMGDTGIYKSQYVDDRYGGADVAAKAYGGGSLTSLVPTKSEQYNLYLYYLQKVIPTNVQNRLTTTPTDKTNLVKIKLKATDGTFKEFYANFNTITPSSITVYTLQDYYLTADTSKHFPKVVAITMQDVINWFNSAPESELTDVDLTADDGGVDPEPTPPEETELTDEEKMEKACYSEAKSLGWILCPTIFGLRDVSKDIYKQVEPLIRVNSSIVNQMGDNTSSMYTAWRTFRDIANIIFVILFLIVMFSQLTGYGIDNYGIKKMLPKLIITAILVNLSYIICAIAIDLSNIVGTAIRQLFENLPASSPVVQGTDSVSGWEVIIGYIFGFFLLVGIPVGAGALAFALNGWALIIPVLLFLLTAIIAIIFAFIVLGVRQALVIMLVVLSPIAFALSLLPNTEKIFKKWLDIFKGVLMVYPIIGALIGAGFFAAKVILSDEHDFLMTLIAGLLCVVPYFFIPSLTRKSLDAAGRIGDKIANKGSRLSSWAKDGINGTDTVKNAKADSAAERAQRRAARYMTKKGNKIGEKIANGEKVSLHQANKYARKSALANSYKDSLINARAAKSKYERLQGSGFDAAMASASMAEDATTTKNWETMLAAGSYSYQTTDEDGKVTKHEVDAQNIDQLADALEHELTRKGGEYDANKVRALSNTLAAKGKEGRNEMYKRAVSAQGAGATDTAMKDFASNIMNNHAGTMKEKHRSLYEFAKENAGVHINSDGKAVYQTDDGEEVGMRSVESYAAKGVGSLTAADMTSMDLKQLERYGNNASTETYIDKNGNETSDMKTLAGLAYSALSDKQLSKDLSAKTREQLVRIARNGGYKVSDTGSDSGSGSDTGSDSGSGSNPGSGTGSGSSSDAAPDVPFNVRTGAAAAAQAATQSSQTATQAPAQSQSQPQPQPQSSASNADALDRLRRHLEEAHPNMTDEQRQHLQNTLNNIRNNNQNPPQGNNNG